MVDPLEPPVDLRAELTALRANEAPVIFFEVVSTLGTAFGVANMTLEATMHYLHDGKTAAQPRVMAHLRFPLAAVASFREALDKIELLAQPPASGEKN